MKVTVNHIPSEKCKKLYGAEFGGKQLPEGLTSNMMCAGVLEGGKDTCQVMLNVVIMVGDKVLSVFFSCFPKRIYSYKFQTLINDICADLIDDLLPLFW